MSASSVGKGGKVLVKRVEERRGDQERWGAARGGGRIWPGKSAEKRLAKQKQASGKTPPQKGSGGKQKRGSGGKPLKRGYSEKNLGPKNEKKGAPKKNITWAIQGEPKDGSDKKTKKVLGKEKKERDPRHLEKGTGWEGVKRIRGDSRGFRGKMWKKGWG